MWTPVTVTSKEKSSHSAHQRTVWSPAQERFTGREGSPTGVCSSSFSGAYRALPDRMVITHSEIDDAYQGRGLAGRLTRGALDDIRAKGLLVIPRCPYTASYIRKHPEYVDLVDDKHRAAVS
jgi:predicted GNAT family acetyltransferase